MSGTTSKVRIDKWLWAVRVFKTRSAANEACRAGNVRINDSSAKAASRVAVGDRVRVRVHGDSRELEVAELLQKRVGAALAANAFIDHTPPAPAGPSVADPSAGRRERGSGRPTKRDRRDIDRLRRGRPPTG